MKSVKKVFYNAVEDSLLIAYKEKGTFWAHTGYYMFNGQIMMDWLELFRSKIITKKWRWALKKGYLIELGPL